MSGMPSFAARWRPVGAKLRAWLTAALFCAGVVAPASGSMATEGDADVPLSAVEDPVRPSFALPALDGGAQDLARHRGQVVLVHFFATWCEPCRPEMARLRELQHRLDGQPVAIVAVSVAEADGAVRRFFASDPMPFSILLDRDRTVAKAWSISTLPSTIVLDHHMKARFAAHGDVDWGRNDVMNIIAGLLGDVPRPAGGG
jgi:peroxiredoxin